MEEEIESLQEVVRLQAKVIESQGEVEQILRDLCIEGDENQDKKCNSSSMSQI